jgi:DNA processing protein
MTPRLLSDDDRLAWLRLARTPGIGPATFGALIARFRTAPAAIDALPDLARRGGLRAAPRLCPRGDAKRERDAVARLGARLIAACEPDYPALLRHIDTAPPVLCVLGEASCLARPAVGIVGARNASAAGLRIARQISGDLGRAGFVVVSGLARGIDTAAHTAAIETGTVAAIAGGIGVVYPPENAGLQARIAETGAVVTEMPPGAQPTAKHFPRRNRIISGLSRGVLVVEAAERSGSLITARLALEQNREVFAVPGSPLDPRSAGTNRLIRNGALLTVSADDILAALDPMLRPTPPEPKAELDDLAGESDEVEEDERARLVSLLGPAPMPVDDLIGESGLTPAVVHTILLELDLAGRLERHGNGAVSVL